MSGKSDLILALAGLVREVNGLFQDQINSKDAEIERLKKELAKKESN